MIVGIGVDIVETRRIARSLARYGERFANKVLATEELERLRDHGQPVAFVSRRFAAKEAVSKVLGTGMRQGVHFRQIVVSNNGAGAPSVHLTGRAAEVADELGIRKLLLSISDEKEHAIAFCVGSA